MNSEREELARLRKALTLADLLQADGWTSLMACSLSYEGWLKLAQTAGVKMPSDETQREVIRQLVNRETWAGKLELERRNKQRGNKTTDAATIQ